VGDIRVGDFWGIKETDEYWNPNGVSCIFVRTEKGKDLLKMLPGEEFAMFKTDYETATLSNMSSYKNKGEKYEQLREKFAVEFFQHGLIAACKKNATVGFWIKHFVPDVFHKKMKKMYHLIVDKR
jgi:coenzyme F420-reducing hydrogenase beta subunit